MCKCRELFSVWGNLYVDIIKTEELIKNNIKKLFSNVMDCTIINHHKTDNYNYFYY